MFNFLSVIGELLTSLQDLLLCSKGKKSLQILLLRFLVTAIVALVFLIFIPAAIFYALENWTYREAIYFCFVSLTTVGFGDFVPDQGLDATSMERSQVGLRGLYRICVACWLIIGLALAAVIVGDFQKLLGTSGKKLRKRLYFWWCKRKRGVTLAEKELVQVTVPLKEPAAETITSPATEEQETARVEEEGAKVTEHLL